MTAGTERLVWAALAVVGLTLAGGLLPLVREWSQSTIRLLLAFGTGVLLGAAFLHMMPEAMHGLGDSVGLWVLAGFLVIYVLERFVMLHPCEEEHCAFHHMGLAAFLGITLHSLIDGFALGAGLVIPHLSIAVAVFFWTDSSTTGLRLSADDAPARVSGARPAPIPHMPSAARAATDAALFVQRVSGDRNAPALGEIGGRLRRGLNAHGHRALPECGKVARRRPQRRRERRDRGRERPRRGRGDPRERRGARPALRCRGRCHQPEPDLTVARGGDLELDRLALQHRKLGLRGDPAPGQCQVHLALADFEHTCHQHLAETDPDHRPHHESGRRVRHRRAGSLHGCDRGIHADVFGVRRRSLKASGTVGAPHR